MNNVLYFIVGIYCIENVLIDGLQNKNAALIVDQIIKMILLKSYWIHWKN